MKVICKNIVFKDGYCKECMHSRLHDRDDSCGNDCPYEFESTGECIECSDPVICNESASCTVKNCQHIYVHDRNGNACDETVCPYPGKRVKCEHPYGDK